jgi:hypothetical protein
MSERRNIFIHGLGITLRRLPALLWTYVFNLGLALIFSAGLYQQLGALMNHSLAAQRLVSGFDLAAVGEAVLRLRESPARGMTAMNFSGAPLFVLLYFIVVPGTLFCYLTKSPARLSTLLFQGLAHFWRFVRITILTAIVGGVVLGLLLAVQGKWADFVDERVVGRSAFLLRMAGLVVILLVASVLRLYFDLVEVYTVQLGQQVRPSGKPDRRVQRTLGPAWRTLRAHFSDAWPTFLFLAILGASAVVLTGRMAMHALAQPRVWPMFLVAQFGLFFMLFTRFWQRGAETSLVLQNPIITAGVPPIGPIGGMVSPVEPVRASYAGPHATYAPAPIADPEPASPSLDEPDPGVFHHNPVKPAD